MASAKAHPIENNLKLKPWRCRYLSHILLTQLSLDSELQICLNPRLLCTFSLKCTSNTVSQSGPMRFLRSRILARGPRFEEDDSNRSITNTWINFGRPV
jgi:hypothetical protein